MERRIKNSIILLLSFMFVTCVMNKKPVNKYQGINFLEMYSHEQIDSMKSKGFTVEGEFIHILPYRRKINSISKIKYDDLISISDTVLKYFPNFKTVYLYCKDTCNPDRRVSEGFYDLFDDDGILGVVGRYGR